jgi:hypothetical protein
MGDPDAVPVKAIPVRWMRWTIAAMVLLLLGFAAGYLKGRSRRAHAH